MLAAVGGCAEYLTSLGPGRSNGPVEARPEWPAVYWDAGMFVPVARTRAL